MRRFVCVAVVAALVVSLAFATIAFAADATGFEGTYVGSVQTSAGNNLGAWVQVYEQGNGSLKLVVRVADGPTIPLWPKVTWNGPDSFTIATSVYIPGWDKPLVDGSGSATFVKSGEGWAVTGSGSGSVIGKSGTATGSGTKVSDDFIQPVLAAGAAASTTVSPTGNVDNVLVGVAVAERQPEVSDGEKAAAGGLTAAAVIAALILCMAMGASMSGDEFAELMLTE